MKVIFCHDWHAYNYECEVSGVKTETILELHYDSTDSDIKLSELVGKNLYLVELWGGDGPSHNEFHLVDSKIDALSSLNDFFERCNDYLEEEEVQDKKRILEGVLKTYFNIQ